MRLIDTSVLIDFFRGVPVAKELMCEKTPAISTISIHEILSGLKYGNNKIEYAFFRNLFDNIELLDYTQKAAEESSSLAAQLRKSGITINAMDLMIAGTAIAHNIFEIALNDKHFKEIEKISEIKVLSGGR